MAQLALVNGEMSMTTSEAPEPADRCIHDFLAERWGSCPQSVAVVSGGKTLTYAELDRRAEALAVHLQALGVRRDVPVGIYLERSADMVVTLLAILKAGGAYVPLDPDFPAERIAYMVEDAAAPVIVTQARLREDLPATAARVVLLEGIDELVASTAGRAADRSPEVAPRPHSAAYIMYTSGSTGKPKGVVVEHRNVVNFLLSMQEEPGMTAADVLVAVTTLSFDISVLELLLPLAVGGRTVVADRETATSGELLAELLASSAATLMQATPSTWRLLIEAGWKGGPGFKVLCGGEALPADLARELFARAGSVWNMYGPTETTVWSTCYRLPAPGAPVLIGRPIRKTQIYVLSRSLQPVPVGVPGEVYIGGQGVARGYLRRDELTAERFPKDPFSGRPGARMYKTGDVGRFLADGNLEFRNRADNQIKLRGFRIELGEIEMALGRHPSVKQAVAGIVQQKVGDARLVAYLVIQDGADLSVPALREHLRRGLPYYMVPQHFVRLDRFPLTPNGKVDRAQLPSLGEGEGAVPEAFVAPRTPSEQAVALAWGEAIGLQKVSADANFFELGGHSVLAIRVVARLKKDLGLALSLRHLFLAPTVQELARQIDALQAAVTGSAAGDEEQLVF